MKFAIKATLTSQCPAPRNESEMKSHLRVYHAGDNAKNKAVMCPHCKKSFTEKNIEKHWAVCYERAQEFVCPDCGRSFVNRGKMNAHYVCAHKMFNCGRCGEAFVGRVKFRQHKVRRRTEGIFSRSSFTGLFVRSETWNGWLLFICSLVFPNYVWASVDLAGLAEKVDQPNKVIPTKRDRIIQ